MDAVELCKGIHTGDLRALLELHKLYSQSLSALACAIVGEKFISYDIVADIFIKLWNERDGFSDCEKIDDYLAVATIAACGRFLELEEQKIKAVHTESKKFGWWAGHLSFY